LGWWVGGCWVLSGHAGTLNCYGPSSNCHYCYYMHSTPLKVARIGNSRGVRLPASTLACYHIADDVLMEERPDGILLRPLGRQDAKLSWEETATAISSTHEDWSDWDATSTDGLDSIPWEPARLGRVAERTPPPYEAREKAPRTKSA
jgi:hypothetical protein